MPVRIAASLALAFTLSMAAAQPADRQPSVTKARNSAVGYALTLEQVASSFAGRCVAVDRDNARAARARWNERNGQLVRSADHYLEFVKRLVTHEKGEEAAQRFYEEQKKAYASRAQLAVIDSLITGAGEKEVCGAMLDSIASGRMDLAAPAHRRALEEIRAEMGVR